MFVIFLRASQACSPNGRGLQASELTISSMIKDKRVSDDDVRKESTEQAMSQSAFLSTMTKTTKANKIGRLILVKYRLHPLF